MLIDLISKKLFYSLGVGYRIDKNLNDIKDYLNQIVVSNENYKKSIDENISIEYTVDVQNDKIIVEIEDKSMNIEYTSVSIDRKGNRLIFLSRVKKDDPKEYSVEDVYQYYDRDVQIENNIVCQKGFSSHLKVFKDKGNLEALYFELYDKKGNKIFSKPTVYNLDEMNDEYKKHV